MLGELDVKQFQVADLLLACNHIRTLPRLNDLPIFELVLAKKKKDKGTKGDGVQQSDTIGKSTDNNTANEEKKSKSKKHDQQKQQQIPENIKEKPKNLELSDPILTHFLKIKFVVGQINSCDVHPDADKLLVEKINIGEENERNVCSGLKMHYNPADLVGKKILLFANLPTRKMVGIKSEGMLLCVESGDTVKVIELPDANVGDVVTFDGASQDQFEW